eukprot:3260449-Rhodomonas_salina.2
MTSDSTGAGSTLTQRCARPFSARVQKMVLMRAGFSGSSIPNVSTRPGVSGCCISTGHRAVAAYATQVPDMT